MNNDLAIQINNLTKTFGNQKAVDNVSLNINRGEIFGLLGPNGAGKTTILRLLTTLSKPTHGTIKIFGHDIKKESALIRSLFGSTGQYASVDEDLSARENIMFFARLNGLSRKDAKKRCNELLNEFSLVSSANKTISNFSGGMRRRLDLAISLITRPKLIFLDEPTTGLDTRTRTQMWQTIRNLVKEGSTIILTTQYLEEADMLADRIALIDHGKLISLGTPTELKQQVGRKTLHIELADISQMPTVSNIVTESLTEVPTILNRILDVPIHNINEVTKIMNQLASKNIQITTLNVAQPTLDDVFLAMTIGKN